MMGWRLIPRMAEENKLKEMLDDAIDTYVITTGPDAEKTPSLDGLLDGEPKAGVLTVEDFRSFIDSVFQKPDVEEICGRNHPHTFEERSDTMEEAIYLVCTCCGNAYPKLSL